MTNSSNVDFDQSNSEILHDSALDLATVYANNSDDITIRYMAKGAQALGGADALLTLNRYNNLDGDPDWTFTATALGTGAVLADFAGDRGAVYVAAAGFAAVGVGGVALFGAPVTAAGVAVLGISGLAGGGVAYVGYKYVQIEGNMMLERSAAYVLQPPPSGVTGPIFVKEPRRP